MICKRCGKEFIGRKRKFCSKECCLNRYVRKELKTKVCVVCGIEFKCKTDKRKWCSMRCYRKLRPCIRTKHKLICAGCGNQFDSDDVRRTYCSVTCSNRHKHNSEVDCICVVCNKHFKAKAYHRSSECCSNLCRDKRRRRKPERYVFLRSYRRKRWQAVKQHEYVDESIVFKRDRWRCHICGKKISASVKWPNPLSPSIDHVIPISKGGSHTYTNVMAAHLGCNQRKQDRTLERGEQMLLIVL